MKTSYFAKYKGGNGVSISISCPKGFEGRQYKKLAPNYWFFKKYKIDKDETNFIYHYQKEVLDKLNPEIVYQELGSSAVILCWESSEKFCHRHLVSKWLEDSLGISIEEYSIEHKNSIVGFGFK